MAEGAWSPGGRYARGAGAYPCERKVGAAACRCRTQRCESHFNPKRREAGIACRQNSFHPCGAQRPRNLEYEPRHRRIAFVWRGVARNRPLSQGWIRHRAGKAAGAAEEKSCQENQEQFARAHPDCACTGGARTRPRRRRDILQQRDTREQECADEIGKGYSTWCYESSGARKSCGDFGRCLARRSGFQIFYFAPISESFFGRRCTRYRPPIRRLQSPALLDDRTNCGRECGECGDEVIKYS